MSGNAPLWPALTPLGTPVNADLAIASVPVPQGADWRIAMAGHESQAVPIAWWPDGTPRQVMLYGLRDQQPIEQIRIEPSNDAAASLYDSDGAAPPDSPWAGPTTDIRIVDQRKVGMILHETNELVINHQGRQVGMRMGVRRTHGFRWWQWLRVEHLWSGPIARAFRVAGYIGLSELSDDDVLNTPQYNTGYWYHRHDWLHAEIYIIAFKTGQMRITARHVNNRTFDKGEDLHDILPVIAFSSNETEISDQPLDNSESVFNLGEAQLDLSRSNDIRSAEHPGRINHEDGLTIVQPYTGPEILLCEAEPREIYELKSSEKTMWSGMARCFGFDLSFGDRAKVTQRYLPPYGWTVHCGQLWPDGALPVRGPMESVLDKWADETRKSHDGMTSGRFYQRSTMWDGEHAHGIMCQAYRTHAPDLYEGALHHGYAMADSVDHTDFTVRIWYMKRGSISQVLHRTMGILAAYLEEGDPYLLRVAESVADAAYNIDRANWPRRPYGRDGAYIRSLTRLYDVTGERHYLKRAGEACRRAAQCQRPDGSNADQGGTVGAHGHANEIIKPWMSSILTEAMVDYLERAKHDAYVEKTVVKNADWLRRMILEDEDGAYWPYEVAFGENEFPPYADLHGGIPKKKHPVGFTQLDYNARSLLWVTHHTGDPEYGRTWQRTYENQYLKKKQIASSYGHVKAPENMPWHEAHLWNARWDNGKLTLNPMLDLIEVGREGTIELPTGETVAVRRTESGVEVDSTEAAVQTA